MNNSFNTIACQVWTTFIFQHTFLFCFFPTTCYILPDKANFLEIGGVYHPPIPPRKFRPLSQHKRDQSIQYKAGLWGVISAKIIICNYAIQTCNYSIQTCNYAIQNRIWKRRHDRLTRTVSFGMKLTFGMALRNQNLTSDYFALVTSCYISD